MRFRKIRDGLYGTRGSFIYSTSAQILILARARTVRVAFSVPAHVHHAWFEQRIQIMSQLSISHIMELNRIILLLDRLMLAHQFNL